MSIDEFGKKAIKQFEDNKIDAVFCYIQNDKELMKEYLHLVAEKGDLGLVNRLIGKIIAQHYNTKANECQSKKQPNSTLIQSYSKLEEE